MSILKNILFAAIVITIPMAWAQEKIITPEDLIGTWVASTDAKEMKVTFRTRLVIKADKSFEKTEMAGNKVTDSYTGTWRLHKGPRSWRYEETAAAYKRNLEGKTAIDFDIRGMVIGKEITLANRDTGELIFYKREN